MHAEVMSDVAARLSESVMSAFDVWDQDRAQTSDEPATTERAAVPLMMLPDPTPDTAPRLLHALLVARAKLSTLALNMATEADDLCEPYQGERAAGARFLAFALDELDAAIAGGFDADREHATHEQQHGRWIDRIA